MSRCPAQPKIYHIVHIDRLDSILSSGYLYSDAYMQKYCNIGTVIGISTIKERRLHNCLASYPDLHVGDCVPFYFCPRSVMLYLFYMNNHPALTYHGGQEPIIHLEADLHNVITWSAQHGQRWVFTTSNAGSYYFDDYCSISDLNKLNWYAINALDWSNFKEEKQAEFLIEHCFPIKLFNQIGVISTIMQQKVLNLIQYYSYMIPINILPNWYY